MKANCGTSNGYKNHSRLKEQACVECKAAHNADMKVWRQNNRDKVKATAARTYEKRAEYYREKAREYGRENADTRKEYLHTYYKENKDKFLEYGRKRRALKFSNGHEPYSTQLVLDMYGVSCHICSDEIDLKAPRHCGDEGWEMALHIDHVIPLSKGGPDTLDNVRPSHGICNTRKNARLINV